jgi:Tfp pilus assembly PilM family ATPase
MNLFTEYVALDIGTSCLKAFSISPGPEGQGFAIDIMESQDLPMGMIGGGFVNPTIQTVPEFMKILRPFCQRIQYKKEGFIIGLPDRWVKLHLLNLGLTPEQAASPEYLSFWLRKQVCPPGFPETCIDFQLLGQNETPEGIRYTFMVGLVQKNVIDMLSHLMIDLRLELQCFDTSTLGVYNLFEDMFPDRTVDRHLILCHIGHETTVVKVFEHGLLRYERVIEVGGEAFRRLLAEHEGIPLPEAAARMTTQRFFPLTREDLIRQISQKPLFDRMFGNWLRELHVTFRFYQDKHKVMYLPAIILSGGSSLLEGLPEFLADFFGTSCQRFNPLITLPLGYDLEKSRLNLGPQFAPCMGLLVR